MIFTPKSKLNIFLYKNILYRRFVKNFAAVNVKNFENVSDVISQSKKNNTPVVFCANHPNSWDISLAIYLAMECMKIDAYFLNCGIEPIEKNFNKLGVVKFTEHDFNSIKIFLKGNSNFLWILPQINITDNNKEMEFSPIISELVDSLKEVILVSCMIDYRFGTGKKPEIFVDFFESKNFAGISYLNKESFTKNLEQKFEYKIKEFQQKFANGDLKDFKKILEGKK